MAVGNTIGRIVGQSRGSAASTPDKSNPAAKLMQGLQELQGMMQQLQSMLQQLKGVADAIKGGGGSSGGGGASGGAQGGGAPEALTKQLTDLGALIGTKPETMEGPPSPDQAKTQQISADILKQAIDVSKGPGQAVDQSALDAARQKIMELAQGAPGPAQAVQALDNASTQAQHQGAKPPAIEMLQQLFSMFKQTLQKAQGMKPASGGAQIRG